MKRKLLIALCGSQNKDPWVINFSNTNNVLGQQQEFAQKSSIAII